MRHLRVGVEALEDRQLLAADGAELVGDAYVVRQNDLPQELALLSNDQFDEDYAGEKRISSVSLGSRGGRLTIMDDRSGVLYAPPADFAGTETFSYWVDTDFSAEVQIEVTSPTADDELEIVPDQDIYEFDLLGNDPFWEGYEGDRKITSISTSSFNAGLAVNDDGQSLTYTRIPHRYGKDTITYIVDDKYPARVTVDILSPTTIDRFQVVQHAAPISIDILENDPFWAGYVGDRLITHILDVPSGSTVDVSDDGKSIEFNPGQADRGTYGFRYVVDSEFEGSLVAHIERPVMDDVAIVDANSSSFPIELLSNDTYRQLGSNNRLDVIDRITEVGDSEHGASVEIDADGQGVLYTPPQGFVGTDSFTYLADGVHRATVTVTVRDPFVESSQRDDRFTVYEGTENNVLDVLKNDFFGDGYTGPRVITSVGAFASGIVEIGEDGQHLSFTPTDEELANHAFSYRVDDLFSATVVINVVPIVAPDHYTYDSPQPRTFRVLDNDRFDESYPGPGLITSVSQPDRGGTVTIDPTSSSLNYVPGAGGETFTYTVDDRFTESVFVRYNARISSDYFAVDQNSDSQTLDVLANDFNDFTERRWGAYTGNRVITAVESDHGNGAVSISDDGKLLQFKPNEDFFGTETLHYTVDGYLVTTVTVDVARRIRSDRFRVEPDSGDNRLEVLNNDLVGADYDGPLRITSVSGSDAGGTLTATEDAVIYTPPAGFVGQDRFEYTVDERLKASVVVEVVASHEDLYPTFDSLESFQQQVLASTIAADPVPLFGFELGDVAAPADGGSRVHSDTNVQVEGVDEADLIETDGDYLYTLTHGQLVISQAWPATEMQVVSRFDVQGTPIGQYLHGDRLAIISQEQEPGLFPIDFGVDFGFAIDRIWPFPIGNSTTLITVLDVSDRAAPTLVQRTEIEGRHVQTRRIDDVVYMVVRDIESLVPTRESICEGEEGSETCRSETDEERLDRIENEFESVVEDLLPSYESFGADGSLVRSGLLVEPEDIFQPVGDSASSLISILSVDMTQDEPGLMSTTGVLSGSVAELYVTSEHLYVLDNQFQRATDSVVEDSPRTDILQFKFNRDTSAVDFVATGSVPGSMVNQFSADEFEGHLRIATTVSNSRSGNYSGVRENALFVLRNDGGVLEHVGTLQNLALNESMQSVRFFGNRAMVTTILTVDPIFSLDLSNHADPQVEGHLVLPGTSTYMQLIDEDRLLKIGKSSPIGAAPIAVSLFNISDSSQPVLIDQFNWDNSSQSPALLDHHAFGWFSEHQLLAIPSITSFTIREDADGDGYLEQQVQVTEHELYAFQIDVGPTLRDDSGIDLSGVISMDSPLLRSAFIEDKLYAVAENSIKATEVADASIVLGEVDITPPEENEQEPNPEVELPPILIPLKAAAKADLSDRLGVAPEEVMLVASEADSQQARFVLRVDDEHFAYHADGEQLNAGPTDYVFQDSARLDWHNDATSFDVNADGAVTPRDVLLAINAINDGLSRLPTNRVVRQIESAVDGLMIDVNDDGFVTARDALLVINEINKANV